MWSAEKPGTYSDGLKLRMPHPFRSRCPKECRRGGKILKNPGKMQFSGCSNLSWSFCNESFVGKFCENLQRNMRLSATHRMPPAKKSRSQHVKHLKPIFSKYSVYVGFYVLCAAHIECRQKHIQMSSFCCKISVFCSRMPPKTYTNVIILLQNLCFFPLNWRIV